MTARLLPYFMLHDDLVIFSDTLPVLQKLLDTLHDWNSIDYTNSYKCLEVQSMEHLS